MFLAALEPFNHVKLEEDEFMLLRAIVYSHMVTNGLSENGQNTLLAEAEKYCKMLLQLFQVNFFFYFLGLN